MMFTVVELMYILTKIVLRICFSLYPCQHLLDGLIGLAFFLFLFFFGILALGTQTQEGPPGSLPTSLARVMGSRFSEEPCFKRIEL